MRRPAGACRQPGTLTPGPLPRTVPDLRASFEDPVRAASRGALAAGGSYLLWGILPVYWKLLGDVPTMELMAHRVIWTLALVVTFQAAGGQLNGLRATLRDPASRRAHLLNSALLAGNWGIYIWAVAGGHIIEASLGYFLVPLLNAGLGRIVFQEHLRFWQGWALGLAAAGVGLMILRVQGVPWIALGLASTWAAYGMVRKHSHAGALNGLALDTLFATPVALAYLAWLHSQGRGHFGQAGVGPTLLLLGTGVISMVPLTLFGYGARRLRFTTLGLLQYIAPSCQFLIGWLAYREDLSLERLGAFALIWLGLACYTIDAVRRGRNQPSPAPVTVPAPSAE